MARRGADALLPAAEPVADGFDWRMSSATARLMPNYSHGTAGVVAALVVAGQALAEDRYLEAARLGAEHLVAVADRTGGGFRLPTCIPWLPRDGEEYTYTWCHGPSGTAYTFAALEHAGGGPIGGPTPKEWRRRCLHSMRTSGIPQRLRPGFWDNDGRCCGTAGAGAAFLDAAQGEAAPNADGEAYADQCVAFARHLADALVERALVDEKGARWRFIEHRLGQPRPSCWLQANTTSARATPARTDLLLRNRIHVKTAAPGAPALTTGVRPASLRRQSTMLITA